MIKEFNIDESHLTSITIKTEWSMYQGKTDLTPEEMLKVLKGQDKCSSIRSEDHPEFAKLRDELESAGYIKTVRNCWNGDSVLKRFKLNGYTFSKGNRFPSAGALGVSLSCAKKYGWKKLV